MSEMSRDAFRRKVEIGLDDKDHPERRFVIEDWAGNRPFGDRTFATFEDGWEHIHTHCPEEDRGEFYVEAITP